MRRYFPTELVYQVFTLLVAFIVVHAVYVSVIRPNAAADMAEQVARVKLDPSHQPERSTYALIKDYEQEACFVLMLWAMAILSFRGVVVFRQQRHLALDLVGLPDDALVTVDSTRQAMEMIRRRLPAKALDYLVPRVLLAALDRFSTTTNVQDASGVVHSMCDAEAERTESELSIIRYIAWAIPSIGFIGTVRGIGNALGQVHRAVEGDITGVTQNLGVAFNSTFIALVISIVLMFLIHQVQLMQERLVQDTRRYSDDWLIRRLRS
jgi:biopolymer transport protein ExbB/TolQ